MAETLFGGAFMFFWLILMIAAIVGMWRVFEKAGHPGWAAIIPIYNTYILTQIADLEIVWFILLFVPFVNIIASIYISLQVAEGFGQSTGFGIGLAFLGFIFYPILGFGPYQYGAAAITPQPTGLPPSGFPPPPRQM